MRSSLENQRASQKKLEKRHDSSTDTLSTQDTGQELILKAEKGRFWIFQAANRNDLHVLSRAILNILGALLFVFGCLLWILARPIGSIWIFASANVVFIITGVWWAWSAHCSLARNPEMRRVGNEGLAASNPASVDVSSELRILTRFEILAAVFQVMGGMSFNLGCLTYLKWPDSVALTNVGWTLGSFLFLLQGLLSQVLCGSLLGPLMPIATRFHRFNQVLEGRPVISSCCQRYRVCLHRCVPAVFVNTVGSATFTLSSIGLCYPATSSAGGWGYLIGSLFYTIAGWADLLGFLDALAARLVHEKT